MWFGANNSLLQPLDPSACQPFSPRRFSAFECIFCLWQGRLLLLFLECGRLTEVSYLFKFKSISSTLVSSDSVKCVLIRSYKTVEPIKALCSKRVRALVFESCNGRALGFADFLCIFHSGVYAKPCEWLHPRSVLHSATAVYLNSSVVSQEELCRRPCNFKGANTKAISSASGVVISYCSP